MNHTVALSVAVLKCPQSFDGSKLSLANSFVSTIDKFSDRFALKVKVFYLSNNYLTELHGISQFRNILSLSLAHNNIAFLFDLEPLAMIKNLENLSLEGNPVTSMPFYREYVLNLCLQVHTFDGIRVTSSERNEVRNCTRKLLSLLGQLRVNELHCTILLHFQKLIQCHVELKRRVVHRLREYVQIAKFIQPNNSRQVSLHATTPSIAFLLRQSVRGGVFRYVQLSCARQFDKMGQVLARKCSVESLRALPASQRSQVMKPSRAAADHWNKTVISCLQQQQSKILSLIESCESMCNQQDHDNQNGRVPVMLDTGTCVEELQVIQFWNPRESHNPSCLEEMQGVGCGVTKSCADLDINHTSQNNRDFITDDGGSDRHGSQQFVAGNQRTRSVSPKGHAISSTAHSTAKRSVKMRETIVHPRLSSAHDSQLDAISSKYNNLLESFNNHGYQNQNNTTNLPHFQQSNITIDQDEVMQSQIKLQASLRMKLTTPLESSSIFSSDELPPQQSEPWDIAGSAYDDNIENYVRHSMPKRDARSSAADADGLRNDWRGRSAHYHRPHGRSAASSQSPPRSTSSTRPRKPPVASANMMPEPSRAEHSRKVSNSPPRAVKQNTVIRLPPFVAHFDPQCREVSRFLERSTEDYLAAVEATLPSADDASLWQIPDNLMNQFNALIALSSESELPLFSRPVEGKTVQQLKKQVHDAFHTLSVTQREECLCWQTHGKLTRLSAAMLRAVQEAADLGLSSLVDFKTGLQHVLSEVEQARQWVNLCNGELDQLSISKARLTEQVAHVLQLDGIYTGTLSTFQDLQSQHNHIKESVTQVALAIRALKIEGVQQQSKLAVELRMPLTARRRLQSIQKTWELRLLYKYLRHLRLRVRRQFKIRAFARRMKGKRIRLCKQKYFAVFVKFLIAKQQQQIVIFRNKRNIKKFCLQHWREHRKNCVLIHQHRRKSDKRVMMSCFRSWFSIIQATVSYKKHNCLLLMANFLRKIFRSWRTLAERARIEPWKVTKALNYWWTSVIGTCFQAWRRDMLDRRMKLAPVVFAVHTRHCHNNMHRIFHNWHRESSSMNHGHVVCMQRVWTCLIGVAAHRQRQRQLGIIAKMFRIRKAFRRFRRRGYGYARYYAALYDAYQATARRRRHSILTQIWKEWKLKLDIRHFDNKRNGRAMRQYLMNLMGKTFLRWKLVIEMGKDALQVGSFGNTIHQAISNAQLLEMIVKKRKEQFQVQLKSYCNSHDLPDLSHEYEALPVRTSAKSILRRVQQLRAEQEKNYFEDSDCSLSDVDEVEDDNIRPKSSSTCSNRVHRSRNCAAVRHASHYGVALHHVLARWLSAGRRHRQLRLFALMVHQKYRRMNLKRAFNMYNSCWLAGLSDKLQQKQCFLTKISSSKNSRLSKGLVEECAVAVASTKLRIAHCKEKTDELVLCSSSIDFEIEDCTTTLMDIAQSKAALEQAVNLAQSELSGVREACHAIEMLASTLTRELDDVSSTSQHGTILSTSTSSNSFVAMRESDGEGVSAVQSAAPASVRLQARLLTQRKAMMQNVESYYQSAVHKQAHAMLEKNRLSTASQSSLHLSSSCAERLSHLDLDIEDIIATSKQLTTELHRKESSLQQALQSLVSSEQLHETELARMTAECDDMQHSLQRGHEEELLLNEELQQLKLKLSARQRSDNLHQVRDMTVLEMACTDLMGSATGGLREAHQQVLLAAQRQYEDLISSTAATGHHSKHAAKSTRPRDISIDLVDDRDSLHEIEISERIRMRLMNCP